MLYDLDNPLQREQFLARAAHLAKKGGSAELSAKKKRSLSQNAYLHCILGYFAMAYGEDVEYVKLNFFKKASPDIFLVWRENELRGRYQTYRSTAALTSEEMSVAITRFKEWAAKEAGVYLPDAGDLEAIRQIEIEMSRTAAYL